MEMGGVERGGGGCVWDVEVVDHDGGHMVNAWSTHT